jgi:predicted dehydrogenase
MSVLRLAVVGPGLMGMKHIELVRADPRTELAAIVQPEPVHARSLAETFGVPVFGDVSACLESVSPDGLILASPNPFHFDQARTCAAAGVPMLIEKPITDDLSEAEALVDLIERSGVKAMVGHHRAHSPLVSAARRVVESGRLGRLVAFQGSAVFRKPDDYFAAAPWRTRDGGGPILINLIHEIGMMRTLCGEIDAVQAQTSSRVRGHAVEDTAAITVSFSGVLQFAGGDLLHPYRGSGDAALPDPATGDLSERRGRVLDASVHLGGCPCRPARPPGCTAHQFHRGHPRRG